MKQLKYILSFLLLLILKLSLSKSFASFSTNEELCVSEIELSEKSNSDFSESGFREKHIFAHSFHHNVSCLSISCCAGYAELVESWKAVSKHTNIRKHISSLEKVSELLNDADFMGKLPNGRTDLDAIVDAVKNPQSRKSVTCSITCSAVNI